ncbi:hypothetical protein MNV_1690006 [Candidatus Methanoperedens nitroreducens]|uniref:Uncharacterized protein n=1 Tax=Candidatus Methanoperedens nitratireducens TaxID=1392998 RepID=A0A284VLN7_9EURY|nr:hypothetical protein MNV_1690006 [Candidatus Methanoperedens nitroreducens]
MFARIGSISYNFILIYINLSHNHNHEYFVIIFGIYLKFIDDFLMSLKYYH